MDTKTFNNHLTRHMTDTFSGFNALCLLPALRPARLEAENTGDFGRVWNFVRPPGVLVKATVLPLNPIVEK
ncbi:MAG TPA: hypothetical protein VJU59_26950 [Paraburkholderia sp.]|uniref:hypothetical protein n=1 Tax=Paraburkholderia sp. TaxID=1926495 RepID=UPI002B490C5E|nr:hypothetical protein [Paraburkholderia sp.]HKR43277.1 hypothetical protein [Paraburkholderia sp.]